MSVEAMGGDLGPAAVVAGIDKSAHKNPDIGFILHGPKSVLEPLVAKRKILSGICTIRDAADVVSMDDKPSQVIRSGKETSMWSALESVRNGEATVCVSCGNTGALMAFSMLALRKMSGVHRPAMTAIWPTIEGRSIVLDVGANLDADSDQLVTFAIMGEAYARAVTGKPKPSIGLLNIGSEEEKGRDTLKLAAERLRDPELGLDFRGYIEGNDIAMGAVDVVVTDGFTGNVALKTAEGTARLVASYVREALTSGVISKMGAALASSGLKRLKEKMDPSNVNGGVLLGLNGVVVKSHGGTDAEGYATAVKLAADLADSQYMEEVSTGLSRDRVEVSLSEASE